MATTTIRHASRKRWTVIDRAAVNDKRLSFRARGILFYLLDKPDGWSVNAASIAADTTEGRDAIRSAMTELETLGYLARSKSQLPNGQWITETLIYEHPSTTPPGPENPSPVDGKPGPGNPDVGAPGAKGLVLEPSTKERSTEVEPIGPTINQRAKSLADEDTARYANAHDGHPRSIPFMALRGVIAGTLTAGFTDEQVRRALAALDYPTVTKQSLRALIEKQARHDLDPEDKSEGPKRLRAERAAAHDRGEHNADFVFGCPKCGT